MLLDCPRVELVGDSLLVVSWCCGIWQLTEARFLPFVRKVIKTYTELQDSQLCAPPSKLAWWIRHVPRELNERADHLAKQSLITGQPFCWTASMNLSGALRAHFDGGCKDGRGSSAWTLEMAEDYRDAAIKWRTVAEASIYHEYATSVSAEMVACSQAVAALECFVLTGKICFSATRFVTRCE